MGRDILAQSHQPFNRLFNFSILNILELTLHYIWRPIPSQEPVRFKKLFFRPLLVYIWWLFGAYRWLLHAFGEIIAHSPVPPLAHIGFSARLLIRNSILVAV